MNPFLWFLLCFLTTNYYSVLNHVVASSSESVENPIKLKKLTFATRDFFIQGPAEFYILNFERNTVSAQLVKLSEDDPEEQMCTLTLTSGYPYNTIPSTDSLHLFTIRNENIGNPMQLKFVKNEIGDMVNLARFHKRAIFLTLICSTTVNSKKYTLTQKYNAFPKVENPEDFLQPTVKTNYEKTIIVENPKEVELTFFPFIIPQSGISAPRFFSQQVTFDYTAQKWVLTPFKIVGGIQDLDITPVIDSLAFDPQLSSNIEEDVIEQPNGPPVPTEDIIFESLTISGVKPLQVFPESLNQVLEWEIDSQTLDMELKVKPNDQGRGFQCDASFSIGEKFKQDPRIPSLLQLIHCDQLNCGKKARLHFEPKLLGEIQDLQQFHNQHLFLVLSCTWDDIIGPSSLNQVMAEVKWIVRRSIPLTVSRTAIISEPIQRVDPKTAILDYFPYAIVLTPQDTLLQGFVYSRQISKINCDHSVRLDPVVYLKTEEATNLPEIKVVPDVVCATNDVEINLFDDQRDINPMNSGTSKGSTSEQEEPMGEEDTNDTQEKTQLENDATILIANGQDEEGQANVNTNLLNEKKKKKKNKTKTNCQTEACETISISFSHMHPKRTSRKPCCEKEKRASQPLIDTPNNTQKEANSMAFKSEVSYLTLLGFLFFTL